MTEGAGAARNTRRALLLAGAAACLPARAQPQPPQRPFLLGLITQGDDERYSPQTLQHGFPDAPGGRSEPAAQIALNDSLVTLQMAGRGTAQLVPLEAESAAATAGALQQLLQRGVQHVVLELPAAGVAAAPAASTGTTSALPRPAICSVTRLSFRAICAAGSARPEGASGKPRSRVCGA